MNAVCSGKMNAGPIAGKAVLCRLASGMLTASWLLAGWLAIPPLAAQETKTSQGFRANGRGNRPRTMASSGAVSNADSVGFSSGNQINYNGGPIMLGTTHIYYIWYGNWDASSIGILTNLASHIGGSSYFNINT